MKPVLMLACAAFLVLTPTAVIRSTYSTQKKTVTHTGSVRTWRLSADGTIHVQLGPDSVRPPDGDSPEVATAGGPAWFRSPPTKTTTREFEQMFIEILIAMEDESSGLDEITVVGEVEIEGDATTPEGAYKIVSVGR